MNSEWSPTSVGEFCPFVYGKGLPDRDRNQAGLVPVVSSAGIIAKHDKAYVNGAGIVIGRKGTIGSLTILEKPFWPIDTAFFIKDEPEKRDLYFTYSLLKSLGLERMNTDSAVPGLNRENAHKVEVLVPSLEVQKKVGRFARAYDQQIATLTQQNVALETIAQRLFRSWFVNFDPVHSKAAGKEPEAMSAELAALFPSDFELNGLVPIPKGWSLESLDTSISYLNGLALQKYPVLEGEAALPVLK
ncbi:MAG: restriction endonuclease subunit S, partial [Hydrogenophaga sp.]|nr:restriction endonuclease subunit S [Hydrogenophaga sp.]